jgi:hypothetical protein
MNECDDCGDIIEDPIYNAMSYKGKRICVKCYYELKEVVLNG